MQSFNSLEMNVLWGVLGSAIVGIAYALLMRSRVLAQDKGTAKMQELWGFIRAGTAAYLEQQFRPLIAIAIVLGVLAATSVFVIPPTPDAVDLFGANQARLWVASGRAVALLAGALFAYTTCSLGMQAATESNVRVAAAARKGYGPALQVAYRAGSVTGMLVVGLGLLGSALILLFFHIAATDILLSFAAGSALLAFFMRIGGGIYSQSANVGADLVTRIELGVPENDPRNAAVVANMVGDEAGDGAGTAGDTFESLELAFAAAIILGVVLGALSNNLAGREGIDMRFVLFPLGVRAIGLIAAIIGNFLVRTDEQRRNAAAALRRGFYLTAILTVGGSAAFTQFYMPDPDTAAVDWRPFLAITVGVALAVLLSRITEYFTATRYGRVREIGRFSRTGSTTNLLAGLSLGLESGVWTILAIGLSIFAAGFIYSGVEPALQFEAVFYSIALTGIGMLSLAGSFVTMNSFGSIADNANRIGSLAGLDKNARNAMEDFDAVGTTIRGMTRGIATGAASITAVALFGAFIINTTRVQSFLDQALIEGINIAIPEVLIGLLIGAAVPWLFSSMTIRAVLRAAAEVVNEARQHLRVAGVKEGTAFPDYAQTIRATTAAAQQELVSLGIVVLLVPIVLALLLGVAALGAFLVGVIISAHLLALLQSTAGSAWGNARRYIEDGNFGGKHSESHKAAIVGALIGEPLRESTGPALNPLAKVVSFIALITAPVVLTLRPPDVPPDTALWVTLALCVVVLLWALRQSRRETRQMTELTKAAAAQGRI